MNDRLQQALLSAQRTQGSVALLVLDLDGFKAVNDSMGHGAGDRVLQQVASEIRSLLREVDTVARLGGDEFALLLPGTDGDGAIHTARKVLRHLSRPFVLDGRPLVVSGSIGIALSPDHGATPDVLLQKADIAMCVAKSGALGFAVYDADRDRPAHERLGLIDELREVIERAKIFCAQYPTDREPSDRRGDWRRNAGRAGSIPGKGPFCRVISSSLRSRQG